MTSDRQKVIALEKKIDGAYRNSALAEARCKELSEKLFLAQKHWFCTKTDFPAKEHFKNEYSAFVYCAFSNGTATWGDFSKDGALDLRRWTTTIREKTNENLSIRPDNERSGLQRTL